METIKALFIGIFGASAGIVGLIVFASYTVGSIYWLWLSFQLGSFWMFFIGIAGPTIIFSGPVGVYSLIFGPPDWLINTFG
mgnify:FL=1|jgi:hypothetical protein